MIDQEKIFNVTVLRESRFRQNMRVLFIMAGLLGGVILSHIFAGSWVIETAYLIVLIVLAFAVFERTPIKERKVMMTKQELLQWLAADCPERWP